MMTDDSDMEQKIVLFVYFPAFYMSFNVYFFLQTTNVLCSLWYELAKTRKSNKNFKKRSQH